ncbi:MAG: CPBP family intramembrane metalloprotease [Ruminococcus sp.]|nr:CPBP family intramembrane metalloprotease [Ruminococcus sp.]
MDKKLRNKEIRKISSSSSLPILIFTIVTIVGSYLIKYVFNNAVAGSIWTKSVFQYVFIQIIIYPVLMPILYFVFYKHRGKSQNMRLRQTLKKPQRSVGWCLKWMIISIGVSEVVNRIFIWVVRFVARYFGITPSNNSFQMGDSILANVFKFLSLIVFAPIFEELLFRAIVCRNNEEMGHWFAVIISGLIFGLWHTNYAQFGLTVTFGIMLGIMYIKTRSIIPTMITHFVSNLVVGVAVTCRSIISPVLRINDIEYGVHFLFVKNIVPTILLFIMLLFIVGTAIAGIVLLIIEIVRRRKSYKMNRGKFGMSTIKKTLVYFSSPVTIVTFALMIFLTIESVLSYRFG